MKKWLSLTLVAALASGCATQGAGYVPVIDMAGKNPAAYHADLQECQGYATQRAGAADNAVAGAVAGALVGVLLGAIVGGGIRNEMAGIGAVAGGLQGASSGEGTQRDIIRRCMAGRGYSVLN